LEIAIAVKDGVATLFGCVESYEQKLAAERAVARVPGIVAIAVELVVQGQSPHERSDTKVAHTIAEYLQEERLVPSGAVCALVEHARVTLEGEVDLFHQRTGLEREIRGLPGVQGVINLVSVRPPESQKDLDAKVHAAVIRDVTNLDPERQRWSRSRGRESKMDRAKKVLVIDDDDDFRASVRPVLEAAGYVVLEATSGHEGLEQLVKHDPDLIVLDIMMETSVEGYGVNQVIKYQDEYKQYRSTPIVMVSSIQESPDDRFPRAGEVEMIRPDAYLTKPLDIDRFLGIVERAVERRRHG
ncbi:MAG: BON domain-containing protein, partial [Gemmatimonadota bacterium]|nr:BON domain-containing protein [Gemmatimonadota bacterium]